MIRQKFGFHCEVHRVWVHLLYECRWFLIYSAVHDEYLANCYVRVFMMVIMGQILSRQWSVLSSLVVSHPQGI